MPKSSPEPPAAPDPNVVAAAQGKANVEAARTVTALNRANQVTPLGKSTWTQTPVKGTVDRTAYDAAMSAYNKGLADRAAAGTTTTSSTGYTGGGEAGNTGSQTTSTGGAAMGEAPAPPREEDFMTGGNPDSWTQTVELDPRSQKLLDAQLASQQSLVDTTQLATNRVKDLYKTGIDYSKLPEVGSPSEILARTRAGMPSQASNIESAGQVADIARNTAGSKISTFAGAGPLSFASAPAMPVSDEAARARVEKALYDRAAARLDPAFQDREAALTSRLANQGITQGSEAYDKALRNEAFARNDAYSSATNDAIRAGDLALEAEFGRDLRARQQGVGEATTLHSSLINDATAATALAGQTAGTELAYTGADLAQKQAAPQIAASEYGLQAADRQRVLAEEERKRALVMNELSALRSGGQVAMPQFGQTPSGASVAPAPIAQAMQNQYASQMAGYNANVASQNAMMGGLVSLGGAAMGMPGVQNFLGLG